MSKESINLLIELLLQALLMYLDEPFGLRIQHWRGWPIHRGGGECCHRHDRRSSWWSNLSQSGVASLNDTLDASQIAWFRLCRVGRTHFSRAPDTRETREERGQIRLLWARVPHGSAAGEA